MRAVGVPVLMEWKSRNLPVVERVLPIPSLDSVIEWDLENGANVPVMYPSWGFPHPTRILL
jgi:hypothetical protein